MRARVRVLIVSLAAACLTAACNPAPPPTGAAPTTLSIEPFETARSPSPLVQVHAGRVASVVPKSWDARLIESDRLPQRGFVASPRIGAWQRGSTKVSGVEVFWVDQAAHPIPSDYYYLVARSRHFRFLADDESCHLARRVLVNHLPDVTGRRFSPSDYVVSASGVCSSERQATRWAYMVAAPGFGPLRRIGIPTSGLYVVVAVVSGPRSRVLLDEIMRGTTFDDTSVYDIERVAIRSQ